MLIKINTSFRFDVVDILCTVAPMYQNYKHNIFSRNCCDFTINNIFLLKRLTKMRVSLKTGKFARFFIKKADKYASFFENWQICEFFFFKTNWQICEFL